MSQKATAVAPSNIALIKYWGATDLEQAIPQNPSVSMTLSRACARTTVEYESDPAKAAAWDWRVKFRKGGEVLCPGGSFERRALEHAQRILAHFGKSGALRLMSENTFPSDAGIASSAAGFAALTVASVAALGESVSEADLSMLARLSGSGSASRSVMGGFVEWPMASGGDRCHAGMIAPWTHWTLCDLIALVETGPKSVSSLDGHLRATSSPHYARRLELLEDRLAVVRGAIEAKDLDALGPVLEEEAIELHLIAMSSRPPIFYWRPGTLAVLDRVRRLRDEGLSAWCTMDAGANVHVLCEPVHEDAVARALDALSEVESVFRDRVGAGPSVDDGHLF